MWKHTSAGLSLFRAAELKKQPDVRCRTVQQQSRPYIQFFCFTEAAEIIWCAPAMTDPKWENMNQPSNVPLCIYLIRHGATNWSLSGQHTGHTDIPLNVQGEQEARGLAQQIRDIPFNHVLTSPRQRARQTCDLAGLGEKSEIEPNLAEWDYGDYEGRRSDEIYKERAGWDIFRDGCPNGETPEQVSKRADMLIARLNTLDGKVALFSHGQFGSVLAAQWIGLALAGAIHFPLSTASVSVLCYDPRHNNAAVIALWNWRANTSEIGNQFVQGAKAVPLGITH